MSRWSIKTFVLWGIFVVGACSGSSDSTEKKKDDTGGGSSGVAGTSGARGGSGGTAAEGGIDPGLGGEAGDSTTGGGTGGFPRGGSGGSGLGGLSGFGGTAGFTAGFSGAGSSGAAGAGTGGTSGLPFGWVCPADTYRDGTCDCGCGAKDVDCDDDDIDTCEVCDQPGACNGSPCPGRINPDDPAHCTPTPNGWGCAQRTYGDGVCHCGCGVADIDCPDDDIESCELCNAPGACSIGACPGAIDANDPAHCYVPPAWGCPTSFYGDGTCDCGCGVPDIDCASGLLESCERCYHGCSRSDCPGTIAPNDNRVCTLPPGTWRCQARFYGDGNLCHCGCGAIDPDCASPDRDLCERCNAEGSCSAQACPGIIDLENPMECDPPPVPDTWTCQTYLWANGTCDCGCGAVDVDCANSSPASCDTCIGCGSALCPGSLLPGDTTKCQPPPPQWECDEVYWADGYNCECGCGAMDIDCEGLSKEYCDNCPFESCSTEPYCGDVRDNDNAHCDNGLPTGWTCIRTVYGDQACDCGCGAQDIDCPTTSRSDCDFCNAPGSCSTGACPGTISATDNRTCG